MIIDIYREALAIVEQAVTESANQQQINSRRTDRDQSGDPLKRPDIYDLIKYGDQKGLRVALTPSGTQLMQPAVIRKAPRAVAKLRQQAVVREVARRAAKLRREMAMPRL